MNEQHVDQNPSVDKPKVVEIARGLFILLGATWLVLGAWSILRVGDSGGSVPAAAQWVIILLMFANSLVLAWTGYKLRRGNKIYYYFGVLVLAGNILLTFTDEFGTFDLITLIFDAGLFILLLVTRSKYLGS